MDPQARGAFYADVEAVAQAELRAAVPDVQPRVEHHATLTFIDVDLPVTEAASLSRLSWVQGVFHPVGDMLQIVEAAPGFTLPRALVWGAKYRGKTHELVTQLALNIALGTCTVEAPTTVFDPMAGRGTTLLWAVRYGLEAWGIEQDPAALDHLQRHLKRQTKLHRLKHTLVNGGTRGKNGSFLDIRFSSRSARLRLITGDSRNSRSLVQNKRFDLLVADLPYGVQFVGPGGTRNPLAVIAACAPAWAASLNPGGAAVLVYNRLQPAREQLAPLFAAQGLTVHELEAPHRMSESILRDLLVLHKP